MPSVPTIPEMPPARREGEDGGTAELFPRYEDVTQDGRMHLTPLMPGLGAAVWNALIAKMPAMEAFRSQGILPILRRLVIVGEDRPVSVNLRVRYAGNFRFAREKGGDRLFANMWLEARSPVAWTLAPAPKDAPYEVVGRLFAEHVVNKPFAPPAERKVTRLDAPGLPAIPEDEHVWEPAESLVDGVSLESAGTHPFGMMHTDSNRHVNSLVYPRVFEEALVRRLHEEKHPRASELLVRALELRWRKPFFAGERAPIAMHVEQGDGGALHAVGAFGDPAKPNCALRVVMR